MIFWLEQLNDSPPSGEFASNAIATDVQSHAYSMQQKQLGVLEWLVPTPWMMMEACSNMRKPNILPL
jgi:hypothetical protein